MINKVGKRQTKGFTIVELLIVVVVIAILAAITIVSYNGIQARANDSAVKAELLQNSKTIVNTSNISGTIATTAAVMGTGDPKLNYSADKYRVVTYCTNGTEFALAAQTKNGNTYYSRSANSAPVNDNAIDPFTPCPALGITTGTVLTTYTNLPSVCSLEGGTCTFSGTATVVYGNAAQGRFYRTNNVTGSISCAHASFGGDPATGFTKSCYVYPNV